MGFLDNLRKALGGAGSKGSTGGGGGSNSFGDDKRSYWIYARCHRCGEPLKARVDLMNEPSVEDDGRWVVRKGLTGSGKNYCFQMVEVTAYFDAKKEKIVECEASGGKVLTAEEYAGLAAQREREAEEAAAAGEASPNDTEA